MVSREVRDKTAEAKSRENISNWTAGLDGSTPGNAENKRIAVALTK
jgi:hypothetical protein